MLKCDDYIVLVTIAVETAEVNMRRCGRHNWIPADYEVAKRELERLRSGSPELKHETPVSGGSWGSKFAGYLPKEGV
jgi:hypothetical protein